MQRSPTTLVKAASFVLGAALAVALALHLGVLRPRHPVQMVDLQVGPADASPRIVPLESTPPTVQPLADESSAPKLAPRPPRRSKRRANADAPRKPEEERRSAAAVSVRAPPPPAEPAVLVRARIAMERLSEVGPGAGLAAEVNHAARAVEIAARELGRRDAELCIDRFYVGGAARPVNALRKCWARLVTE